MASSYGSSYLSSLETTNFARICRIVVDVLRDILWQVLIHEIPAADLPKIVHANKNKLGKLDVNIKAWLCGLFPSSPEIPVAEKLDVSSIYTLIRNLCSQVPAPTTQWGKSPLPGGTNLGDDIERVREFRNILYGHATQAKIDSTDFSNLCIDIKSVVSRFDAYFSANCKAMKCDFKSEIDTILTCSMDKTLQDVYIDKIRDIAFLLDDLVGDVKHLVVDVKQQVGNVEQQVGNVNKNVEFLQNVVKKECMDIRNCWSKTDADLAEIKETLKKKPDVVEKGKIIRQGNEQIQMKPSDEGISAAWNFSADDINGAWQSIEQYLLDELPKNVLPYLEMHSTISAEECETIRPLRRRRQIAEKILNRIKQKLPEAFINLLSALNESRQEEIVDDLINIIAEKKNPEINVSASAATTITLQSSSTQTMQPATTSASETSTTSLPTITSSIATSTSQISTLTQSAGISIIQATSTSTAMSTTAATTIGATTTIPKSAISEALMPATSTASESSATLGPTTLSLTPSTSQTTTLTPSTSMLQTTHTLALSSASSTTSLPTETTTSSSGTTPSTRETPTTNVDTSTTEPGSCLPHYTVKIEVLKDGRKVSEVELKIAGHFKDDSTQFAYELISKVVKSELGSVTIHLRPLSKHAKDTLKIFCVHDGMKNFVLDLLRKKDIFSSLPEGKICIQVQVRFYDGDATSEDGNETDFTPMTEEMLSNSLESFEVLNEPQVIRQNLLFQFGYIVEEIEPLQFQDTFVGRGIWDKQFFDQLKRIKGRKARAVHFLNEVLYKDNTTLSALVDALKNSGSEDLASMLCFVEKQSQENKDRVDDSLLAVVTDIPETCAEGDLWSCHLEVYRGKNVDGDQKAPEVFEIDERTYPISQEIAQMEPLYERFSQDGGELHQNVLNRCLPALMRDLDFKAISTYIQEKELFDEVTVRDILEQKTTSDKIRELIKQVQQRNQDTYEKFKDCLIQAKQTFLKALLEEEEAAVAKEITEKHETLGAVSESAATTMTSQSSSTQTTQPTTTSTSKISTTSLPTTPSSMATHASPTNTLTQSADTSTTQATSTSAVTTSTTAATTTGATTPESTTSEATTPTTSTASEGSTTSVLTTSSSLTTSTSQKTTLTLSTSMLKPRSTSVTSTTPNTTSIPTEIGTSSSDTTSLTQETPTTTADTSTTGTFYRSPTVNSGTFWTISGTSDHESMATSNLAAHNKRPVPQNLEIPCIVPCIKDLSKQRLFDV